MAVSISISITQNSQSIPNNTSNVTVKVIAKWTYGSFNHNKKPGWLKIDGTTYDFTSNFNTSETTSGSKTLYTKTLDIKHGNDGKKTLSCSASFTTGVSSGTVTASASKALTAIPRAAVLESAPNFNDEANPKITYSNPAGSAATTLQACIADSSGDTIYAAYRDISKSGTEYTFSLTSAERTTLRNAAKNAKSITVKFYVKTIIGDNTYYSSLSKTLSIVNANPTVSPVIVDTNSVTKSLTGDDNTLIRYFSNAKVTFNASALKGASIASRRVLNGSKYLTSDGTINAVESGTFEFTVRDSRGNSVTKSISKPIVNYVKLTCGFANTVFSTDGDITFNLKGNCFSGSFGTTSNVLILRYRYKTLEGAYSEWVNVDADISNNTYSESVTISGLDYREKYIVQAEAIDELATIFSTSKTLSCIPVFDWSAEDFNFNVPVGMVNNNRINGTTTDGTILNAFQPCNQNNNLVIGYGGYTGAIGATNLYGNDVNVLTNTDFTVNDGTVYSLLGAVKALTNTYSLECTVTPGSGYSECEATAVLVGNNLRIYLKATRDSNIGIGDIVNEKVMGIKIAHNDKIKTIYATGFTNSATGSPATFFADASKDGSNINIDINICGVSVADNAWSAHFSLPCTINLSAYV
jgi:hypothetical protein